MWIVGAILLAIGIGLIIARWYQHNKLQQIKATETSTAQELQELAKGVADEIGAGSFNQVTEVKGAIRCDHPLESELAKVSCVYYHMTVTRRYEEEYYDTDSNGNRVRRRRTGT